ncbi:hypothetical protein [Paraburkholderia sp. HP33-1]|uniref:hypothetical protein n=1 Tax=Paraburkholderia sp. HP33-1 TaxID=2883243 RepID=UPI001F42B6B6|nr:hypothetical protein [Paraburkholderia sp. HP33-1]
MSDLPIDIQAWIEAQERPKAARYRQARFLKTEYKALVWKCDFGTKGSFEIDWRVTLSDGSLLTAAKNARLLDSFRVFLCVQAHPDSTSQSFERADNTTYHSVRSAMWIIDYFLLNDESLKLHQHALAGLTESDIERMLSAFAASSTVEGVYDWRTRLTELLRRGIKTVGWDDICQGVKRSREIVEVRVEEGDRELELSEVEIIYARFWLRREGLARTSGSKWPYTVKPNAASIASRIFNGTIAAYATKLTVPEELCWAPKESYSVEYPRSAIRAEPADREQPRSLPSMRSHLRVARCLRLVSAMSAKIPKAALRALTAARAELLIASERVGHFLLPSPEHVKFGLEKAIEFFKKQVPHILSSYVSVIQAAFAAGEGERTFATRQRVSNLIEEKTRLFGVKVWNLSRDFAGVSRLTMKEKHRRPASQFFYALRNNEGLVELAQIALGACLFIVGALTGRRQGELQDLKSDKCVDVKQHLLVFANRKSGILGVRNIESRPIPPLVSEVIICIQNFHAELRAASAISGATNLFSTVTANGACVLSGASMNRLLDRFIDYIELPLNPDGTRSYIRQHQLRRFFVTDYYRNRGGNLATLTWYLGHTHLRQIEAYLDSDYGAYERERSQAHVAVEGLQQSQSSPYESLRDLIDGKFGTRNAVFEEADAVEDFLASKRHDPRYKIIDEVLAFRSAGTLKVHFLREG